MLSGSKDGCCAVMNLVRQVAVPVFSGNGDDHRGQVLIVMRGGSERSVDVSRKGNRMPERPPAVMFHTWRNMV